MDPQALCSWCSFALFYVNSSHDFLPLEWRGKLSLSALLFPIPSVTWEDIHTEAKSSWAADDPNHFACFDFDQFRGGL